MIKTFTNFFVLSVLSTQLVFASSVESSQKRKMFAKMKKMTRNLSKHIEKGIAESPEYKRQYLQLAKDLKSKTCKIGIKKDLSMLYSCGKKSIKSQFLIGKSYFLLEGQKIPYSLLDDKAAYLKRAKKILKRKNIISSFFDKATQLFFPKAHAQFLGIATADWIAGGLFAAAFAGSLYRVDKRKRKRENLRSESTSASAGAGTTSDEIIVAGETSAKPCSVALYFKIRPDVSKDITNYYTKNNLTKSDDLDYKRALRHFNNHGEKEGMCQPQPPGFVDKEVAMPEPETEQEEGSEKYRIGSNPTPIIVSSPIAPKSGKYIDEAIGKRIVWNRGWSDAKGNRPQIDPKVKISFKGIGPKFGYTGIFYNPVSIKHWGVQTYFNAIRDGKPLNIYARGILLIDQGDYAFGGPFEWSLENQDSMAFGNIVKPPTASTADWMRKWIPPVKGQNVWYFLMSDDGKYTSNPISFIWP